jgi:uncharacterized protein (DUF952 family)
VTIIYKIATRSLWREAEERGVFMGAPVDAADGFIHFSTARQVAETFAKHFRGKKALMLAAVPSEALGEDLKWEPSRGGDLFPHLYGPLSMDLVLWARAIPEGADGEPTIEGFDL